MTRDAPRANMGIEYIGVLISFALMSNEEMFATISHRNEIMNA